MRGILRHRTGLRVGRDLEVVSNRNREAALLARSGTPFAGERRRALVVDSDSELLAFVAEGLNSFRPGLDVATARSVAEAENWLHTFRPDVLLIADDVPDGDLAHLAERIRGTFKNPNCRLVLLSKATSPELRLNPGRLLVHAILPKPLTLKALLATTRRLLES